MAIRRLQLFFFVIFFAVSGLAKHKELKPGMNLFSKEQDVQLGREASAQVEQQMSVVRDAQIQQYVQEIGRKLASAPEADKYPYTFKVINDKSINAFALPGGPTYVNTGLIAAAENEAQLAGVMAHEIAHVALRHGTNQASKANLLQLPAMLAGAVLGGGGGMLGQLAQIGVGLGFNSVLLKYSRDAERQADLLGAQMMAHAGYNPMEMARFFEKLAAQGGRSGPQFLSSHPDPGDRMKLVQEEVQTLPRKDYSLGNSAELKQVQSRLGSLPAPAPGTRARSVEGGGGDPRPSGKYREYRNRAYSVSHPDNWEVFGDQGGAAVTIAPRAGLVQDNSGSVAIGFGAILSFYNPRYENRNLAQDTNDLIASLRQGNPAMQTGGRQQRVNVNGSSGLITTLSNQSPLGGREIDMLVTVDRPEGVFYMVFIAPESEYRNVQPVFEQMLRSVRF